MRWSLYLWIYGQYDVHLCGYSALLQIVAKFHDEIFSDPSSPTGLNKACVLS